MMLRKLLDTPNWRVMYSAALAVLLAALVAVADELHQATLPGRVAGYDDLLADGVGIALGLLCVRWLWRRFAR